MFPFCSSLPHRLCLLPSHPGPRGPPPSTFWAQADPVLSPINTLPPVFQKGAHLLLADDSSHFPPPWPFWGCSSFLFFCSPLSEVVQFALLGVAGGSAGRPRGAASGRDRPGPEGFWSCWEGRVCFFLCLMGKTDLLVGEQETCFRENT